MLRRDPLQNVRVATPCEASWERMAGDERVRHCALCDLNVYNFAELTRAEILALLQRSEGRVCGRLYRRADGTLITRDCPTALARVRRRVSRFGSALVAAALSVVSFGCATLASNSRVQLETEHSAGAQDAAVTGVVDLEGSPLPGATVSLRDELTQREMTAVTDINGAFTIASPREGVYRFVVTLEGATPAVAEHVAVRRGEVTHATVALRIDPMTPAMGIVTVNDPVTTNDGISTTFSQDFINKLPM